MTDNVADVPLPEDERSIRLNLVIDEEFLAGLAIFILAACAMLGLWSVWHTNLENDADEHIARIEACDGIEDAAERTLCLGK